MGTWQEICLVIALISFLFVLGALGNALARIEAVAKEAKAAAERNFEQLEIIQRKLSDLSSRVQYMDELFGASKVGRERYVKDVEDMMRQTFPDNFKPA
jgi:hypothetical protein